jgi:hypothetical protein
MSLFLHLRDTVFRVKDQAALPVPLDPDLLFIAENAKQSNIIQQLYRTQMERNRSRGPFGDAFKEEDHPRGQPSNAGQFAKTTGKTGEANGGNTEGRKETGTNTGGAGQGGTRSPSAAQSSAKEAASGRPKLTGLPDEPMLLGDSYYVPGPLGRSHDAAEEYMKAAGLKYDPPHQYVTVDDAEATQIADAFDKMKHDPDDPKVKAAYAALVKETLAQWRVIKKTGLKVQWIKAGEEDPYVASLNLIPMDARENNHMWEFPTELGYGTDDPTARHNNPMLQPTDEVIDGHKCVVNDIFRIVHDYFGHFKDGVGFTDDGEENAWRSHAAMYSPLARGAMTSETRGQASWVNHGPHGKTNYGAEPGDIIYAPQKIGLMPPWTWEGVTRDAEWEEHKHPRDEDGKFSSGAGATSPTGKTAKESWEEEPPKESPKSSKEAPKGLPKSLRDQLDIGGYRFEETENPDADYGRHIFRAPGKPGQRVEYAINDWGEGRYWEHVDENANRRYSGYGNLSLIGHLKRYEKGEVFDSKFAKAFGDKLFKTDMGFKPYIESDTAVTFQNVTGDQIFIYKDYGKATQENAKWKIINGDTHQSYNEGAGWDDLHENLKMLKDQHEGEKREADRKWSHTVEEYTSVASDMMKALGYPPAKLTIEREPYTFTLNGSKRYAAGVASLATGEVVLYPEHLSYDGIRGVTAHEVMHQKFQAALNEYDVEREAIRDDERGDRYTGVLQGSGEVAKEFAEDYPVYATLYPLMMGDMNSSRFNELQKSDGVTGYSREWWQEFESGKAKWQQAFHETLAEMAYLEVTNPAKLKEVAKPWRDLYREVTLLYKDQEKRKWRKAERKQEREREPEKIAASPAPTPTGTTHPAVTQLAHALAQVLNLSDRAFRDFDPAEHPHAPKGAPEGAGGQFVSKAEAGGGGAKTETSTESAKIESRPKSDSPKSSHINKPLLPGSKKSHPATISTRRPTYKGAPEGDKYRQVDVAAMKEHKPKETENEKAAVEANFDHDTKLFSETEHYPNFRPGEFDGMTPDERVRHAVDHMKSNLKFLYDNVDEEVHDQGPLWYEGAHRMADEAAKKYKIPLQSATGVYAALSPQALWDENAHFAKHVLEIYFDHADHAWDDKMEKTAQRIWKPKDKPLLDSIKDKKLSELTNPAAKAMWIRTYDETHMERHFEALSPDGHELGYKYKSPVSGNPLPARWKSLSPITNAVLCIESNGDRDIISPAMGDRHKVRSFYNNILDPDSDNGDVTIDTHAAGAALLRPSSQTDVYVMHMFGKGPSTKAESEALNYHGTSGNSYTGMSGLYPIYAQAYRELAEELHIKPRVLQSITWEAKRRLFGEPTKQESRQAKQDVELAWRNYRDGKSTLEETQTKVLRIGRALAEKEKGDAKPSDSGDSGFYEGARYTGDARQFHQRQLGRGATRSLDARGRGRATRGVASGARLLWRNARLAVFLR